MPTKTSFSTTIMRGRIRTEVFEQIPDDNKASNNNEADDNHTKVAANSNSHNGLRGECKATKDRISTPILFQEVETTTIDVSIEHNDARDLILRQLNSIDVDKVDTDSEDGATSMKYKINCS